MYVFLLLIACSIILTNHQNFEIKMDNTSESNQPGSDAEADSVLQSELPRLLDEAKPESEGWQETVGKLVSQHNLRTL